MNTTVLRAAGIGKKYHIGAQREEYRTLRDAIVRMAKRPIERIRHPGAIGHRSDEIWALRDLSFEISQGDSVGIIGRNGAGKSTLLKILSGITELTEGRVDIRGRVGSLLEVGTGFHPELTGRENIWLNAAILGMSRSEVSRRFDDIVEFAEISRFLDTPVKRYSSGMYVRLAFAVAAHLEPEILVVDEVLAVGDVAFQRKCLGKMRDVAGEGRTVLFVSHNMGAITRLCARGIWLEQGGLVEIDTAEKVVASYLSAGSDSGGERLWPDDATAPGGQKVRLRAVRVLNDEGDVVTTVDMRKDTFIEIDYHVFEPIDHLRVTLRLLTSDGTIVLATTDKADTAWRDRPRLPGDYTSRCVVPGRLLNATSYTVGVYSDIPFVESLYRCESAVTFTVENTGMAGGEHGEPWPGAVSPELEWTVSRRDE
jgi:lipopolysaccharide transport system ATP-binding protein